MNNTHYKIPPPSQTHTHTIYIYNNTHTKATTNKTKTINTNRTPHKTKTLNRWRIRCTIWKKQDTQYSPCLLMLVWHTCTCISSLPFPSHTHLVIYPSVTHAQLYSLHTLQLQSCVFMQTDRHADVHKQADGQTEKPTSQSMPSSSLSACSSVDMSILMNLLLSLSPSASLGCSAPPIPRRLAYSSFLLSRRRLRQRWNNSANKEIE